MTSQTPQYSIQELKDQIARLTARAKQVNADISQISKETNEQVEEIKTDVSKHIAEIDAIFSELDQANETASNELDALAVKYADDVK